jgi:hypothetical protein
MHADPTLTIRLPNTRHRAAVAASVVLGVVVAARVGALAADRISRGVGEAVRGAPAEVVIEARESEPTGVALELRCPDQSWCESTAALLGGESGPGFVRLHVSRGPLKLV